jgi:molybdopterin-binding protein
MNLLKGVIKQISKNSILNLITVEVNNQNITAITLQLNEQFQEGKEVILFFKETEVLITQKNGSIIGAENVIPSRIISIKKGNFFSEFTIDSACGNISVLLSNFSLNDNKLSEGDSIFIIIKATEISLSANLNGEKL